MTQTRQITLADVAARAGVSPITVSRALRNPSIVSETTRRRIEAAIRDLGYVPDPMARALASGRTDVIGVIIPSVTNSVFAEVLRGIYSVLESTPYGVQLGNSRYSPALEEKSLRVFLSQKPAGLIVAGIDQSATAHELLCRAPCPVVQIMETGPDPVDMMVGFSHYEAARLATRHLLEAGYTHPAFIGARMDPRSQRRYQGYRDEMAAAGLSDPGQELTTTTPSSVTLGAELFAGLRRHAPQIDAVFCNNDDLALGVLFEARRLGLRVPQDLGICGFNDLEVMAVARPGLTSVRTHRHEMGVLAAQMILERLSGQVQKSNRVVDLGYDLIARESTRR